MSNNDEQDDPKIARFPKKGERTPADARRNPPDIANDYRAPHGDREPVFNIPPAVKTLCIVLLSITAVMYFLPQEMQYNLRMTFGFIPGRYSGVWPFDYGAVVAPFTHLFIHGGWLHIAVNIGMLMAFGSALEKAIGARRLLLLYLLSGLAGALTHWAFYPSDVVPLIGASGAISGLFGGVLMVMQRQGMLGDPQKYGKLALFIAVWAGISLFFGFAGMPGAGGAIAWTAHVGGFVAGMLLFNMLVREPVQFRP